MCERECVNVEGVKREGGKSVSNHFGTLALITNKHFLDTSLNQFLQTEGISEVSFQSYSATSMENLKIGVQRLSSIVQGAGFNETEKPHACKCLLLKQ